MERALFLVVILSLLVCPIAAIDVASYVPPHVTMGSGSASCQSASMVGLTITASCTDGTLSGTLTASTDKDGSFSINYYTDNPPFPLNAAAATCNVTSIQPAAMTVGDCTCSFNLASLPLATTATGMNLSYDTLGGCTILSIQEPDITPPPPSGPPCQKLSQIAVDNNTYVYTISDVATLMPGASATDADCGYACMAQPNCAFYSWNPCPDTFCTLYPKGAIALSAAEIDESYAHDYGYTYGRFLCPTYITACR